MQATDLSATIDVLVGMGAPTMIPEGKKERPGHWGKTPRTRIWHECHINTRILKLYRTGEPFRKKPAEKLWTIV